jgi:hypothetical protein
MAVRLRLKHINFFATQHSLVVRRINEIAPMVIVSVQKLETCFLVHGAHAKFLPFVSNAHGAELKRRDGAPRHWVIRVDIDRALLVVVEEELGEKNIIAIGW